MPIWLMFAGFAYFEIWARQIGFVEWIIILPILSYPLLVIGCSFFSWKNHLQKPIFTLSLNLIPMIWIFAYWMLCINFQT